MSKRLRLVGAVVFMVLVVLFPARSVAAARAAMRVWAEDFCPALFPFFVLLPALTSREATEMYRRVFSRPLGKVLGLRGDAAGAVMVAMMAGSPAGSIALGRVSDGMTRGELSRCAIVCGGLSPAFLISSVGAAMSGSSELGVRLMLAQLVATLAGGWLLRAAWSDDVMPVPATARKPDSALSVMGEATVNMLTVCGWMVMFSVAAGLLSSLVPGLGAYALPFLEIANGCRLLTSSGLDAGIMNMLLGFFCGLGGLCVFLQNHQAVPHVPAARLALGKVLHATLASLFMGLTWAGPNLAVGHVPGLFDISMVLAALVAVGAWALCRPWRSRRAGEGSAPLPARQSR